MKPLKYSIWCVFFAATSISCGSESSSRRDNLEAEAIGAPSPTVGAPPAGSELPTGGGPGNSNQSPPPESSPNGPVVLGFFGGFTSCDIDEENPDPTDQRIAEAYERSVEAVKGASGQNPVTIRSCFTSDPRVVHFTTSVEPNKVSSIPLNELSRELGNFLKLSAPGGRLRLVGHSYGGWTVLSLAKDLDPSIAIDALVTVDPISVRDCSIGAFLGGGAGCRRAPQDFGEDGLAAIKKRVGKWLNLYQVSDTALVSGAMNGAENILMNYPREALGPHNAFLGDPAVIERIATFTSLKSP